MKILMIDKFFFIKGGAERYYFELTKLLEDRGHSVIPFSMTHPDNFPTPYASHFVDRIDYDFASGMQKVRHAVKVAGRMVYSIQAQRKIEALIRETQPDIAHVHMIDHQISPSILPVLKRHGIPVIQTVHQYKLVCPNYRLYNMRTKRICEKCLGGSTFHPIFERCHKDSAAAGALIAVESGVHRLMRIYERNIDVFHVPSRFMGRKLEEGGISPEKIEHRFYTIRVDDFLPHYGSEDYFLYFGRLAEEKGIMTLLKAMRRIEGGTLVIAGEGPMRPALEAYAQSHGLDRVRFIGYKGGEELKELVSRSRFVVLPSEWYDNSPLVIYEAAALGKPVVASRIGGIPELIDDGETGLLFDPGDVDGLSRAIDRLDGDDRLRRAMGKRARFKAENDFAPERHYEAMMTLYERISDVPTR